MEGKQVNLPFTPPILTSLDRGRAQTSAAFRSFTAQFTQTELMRLCEQYLQTKLIHSSTITGLKTGCETYPKVLTALGYLNIALARSNGYAEHLIETAPDVGYNPTLDCSDPKLWRGKSAVLDSNNIALGPSGLFEAFVGLRDLKVNMDRSLTPTEAPEACKAAGAFLRQTFATRGVDWFSQLDALADDCAVLRPVLTGQEIDADLLLGELRNMADLAGTSETALWEHIQSSLGR
ncbi:MAG: hypothetical protein ACO3GP_01405 [Candidatus Limnocylindrus sp.]